MTQPTALLPHEALSDWATACLQALDVPPEDARTVATSLVQTSLWGIDSHGIARLPHYLNRLQHGSIRARPDVRDTLTGPCTAQVDGGQGLGIVVAHHANRLAMRLAQDNGLGAVGVADSSHCGAIGLYTREAARAGLIGIAFTHADRIAAPHGGHQPFFGTNPISIAFAREGGEPVCLDMATTSIPWNRVMNARREGRPIAPGVAVDADGVPSTDAQAVRALSPLGGADYGHKGYGLALAIDLLCGPLNGNPYGPFITPMYEQLDRARQLGAFFLAIDPLRFAGGAVLAAAVAHMAGSLAAEPGSPRMPGDPELDAERVRRAEGIPVEAGLQAEFRQWSERLRVPSPL